MLRSVVFHYSGIRMVLRNVVKLYSEIRMVLCNVEKIYSEIGMVLCSVVMLYTNLLLVQLHDKKHQPQEASMQLQAKKAQFLAPLVSFSANHLNKFRDCSNL